MYALYFILGLMTGLYLNSFWSDFTQRIAMNLLAKNPELMDKFNDSFNGSIDLEIKKKASKFQERMKKMNEHMKEMTPND